MMAAGLGHNKNRPHHEQQAEDASHGNPQAREQGEGELDPRGLQAGGLPLRRLRHVRSPNN